MVMPCLAVVAWALDCRLALGWLLCLLWLRIWAAR
jgi:hypothetical protein